MQTVHLFDEIDATWGIGAAEFTASLPAGVLDVELHINSPGGNAFEGLAIYNALKQRTGTVRVIIDGLAASIASIIAQAASPVSW